MKKINPIFLILIFIIFVLSCKNNEKAENNLYTFKIVYFIDTFYYDSLTIPKFFDKLCDNHLKDFYQIDSNEFIEFCNENSILSTDLKNISNFYKIKILHQLFTSKKAYNGSMGEILKIPYQWHWIQPNPRHEIIFTSNKKYLKDTKPPAEFSKYNSFADIDRTPYLFLSDLVDEKVKYYSNQMNDSFSSFGWCSEKEMAFVALMNTLNFKGKVVTKGNHSWSEFIVNMKQNTGKNQSFRVKVDNTFDIINWEIIYENEIKYWENYVDNTNLSKRYNQKANSKTEIKRIATHIISKNASNRIEHSLVRYLDFKLKN